MLASLTTTGDRISSAGCVTVARSPMGNVWHWLRSCAGFAWSATNCERRWSRSQFDIRQHHETPQPDTWFYAVPEICDGGPCETTADALRRAVQHVRQRTVEQRQELDEMTQSYRELRSKLDQTEDGDGRCTLATGV